jgi:hypothetical protein
MVACEGKITEERIKERLKLQYMASEEEVQMSSR